MIKEVIRMPKKKNGFLSDFTTEEGRHAHIQRKLEKRKKRRMELEMEMKEGKGE